MLTDMIDALFTSMRKHEIPTRRHKILTGRHRNVACATSSVFMTTSVFTYSYIEIQHQSLGFDRNHSDKWTTEIATEHEIQYPTNQKEQSNYT
jgi:hypothetical protein